MGLTSPAIPQSLMQDMALIPRAWALAELFSKMGNEKWDREGPWLGTCNKSRLQSQSQQPSLVFSLVEPRVFLSVRLLLLVKQTGTKRNPLRLFPRGFTNTLGSLGELWA